VVAVGIAVPDIVAEKVLSFPESSMGAHRVTLVLADGRRVGDVTLAWGHEIVRVGGRDITEAADLDFAPCNVVDAVPALER
jgi:hypothetical protein